MVEVLHVEYEAELGSSTADHDSTPPGIFKTDVLSFILRAYPATSLHSKKLISARPCERDMKSSMQSTSCCRFMPCQTFTASLYGTSTQVTNLPISLPLTRHIIPENALTVFIPCSSITSSLSSMLPTAASAVLRLSLFIFCFSQAKPVCCTACEAESKHEPLCSNCLCCLYACHLGEIWARSGAGMPCNLCVRKSCECLGLQTLCPRYRSSCRWSGLMGLEIWQSDLEKPFPWLSW